MKRFTTRILVCLVPTILSIAIVAWAYNQYVNGRGGFRLGVDLAGGTILVYEVDETKLPENFKAEDLAAALKRRIDPADLYNITIRPVPGTPPRVEIILPTGGRYQAEAEARNWNALVEAAAVKYGNDKDAYAEIRPGHRAELVDKIVAVNNLKPEDRGTVDQWVESRIGSSGDRRTLTGEEVEVIKGLIERQGRLEFKILANSRDDKAGLEAGRKWFDDAKNQAELKRLEVRAEPPPPPRRDDGGTEFPVTHPNGTTDSYAYRWVELGKSELYSLGLNSAALAANDALRKQIEDYRSRGKAFSPESDPVMANTRLGSPGMRETLLFSRRITDWSRRLIKDRDQGKEVEFFMLVREPSAATEIRGDDLVGAREDMSREGGRRAISFTFNPEGGERFWELTTRNRPEGQSEGSFRRHLAILFDGQIVSAPSLNSPIRTHGQITGDFTQQEINDMVRILRAGALPATLKKDPVSQNSMSPTLGEDTITKGTWSILWSFVAVMAFMVFYYRFAGLVACVALLANLVLTIAFMVVVQAAFTLPGLAGLVLMLGMAVDANVLIYERLREERDAGANLAQALRNGYERAFPTILDTHLSSIFTAIVLYVVGNDQLKGFGISLTVGLIISLFTSLYMTRTIFNIWLANGWLKELNFFSGLVNLIHARYWDFMSIRHYWFAATAVLTVLGAALFIYRADSDPQSGKATVLNIDFTGGTAFTGRLARPMSLRELREKLDVKPLPDQAVEQLFVQSDDPGASERSARGESEFFTVRTSERDTKVVLNHILALMKDDLKQLRMKVDGTVDDKTTQVTLTFTDQEGNKDFTSPAMIASLLNDRFNARGLARATFSLDRPTERAKERQDHYSELILRLNEPVKGETLSGILKEVQAELAATPVPERLENFDKQLAASTQERALYAIVASWVAILLFLWFRFGNWTFGAAAVVCLVHDLFFTLGCIAACHYIHGTFLGNVLGIQDFKIDLPAIAALLTLVGYSVNDTIVVFDRIREVRGKSPQLTTKMINDAVNQTLTRTLLASATVMVVVLVLYIFGGDGVKLFAFVMIVGVFVGTYSSIYIASPLLMIFGEGQVPGAPQEKPVVATGPSTSIKK
jgi:SecD/SecF fusion protein